MIPLSLAAIAEITGARLDLVADAEELVTGPVVIDSRNAAPGGLFAALPGERADGHDFAGRAVSAGAVAALASRPVGVPALITPGVTAALGRLARAVVDRLPGLSIAAITGSVGKTTTKDLAAQLIESLGPAVAPYGSYNNEIGHPLTVLRVCEHTRYLVLEVMGSSSFSILSFCLFILFMGFSRQEY
ncbi:MAG TPA: Mur ligase family protein [Streptosporangiaceae bacterium]